MCPNQLLAFIGILTAIIFVPYLIGLAIIREKPAAPEEYILFWSLGLGSTIILLGIILLLCILWKQCANLC